MKDSKYLLAFVAPIFVFFGIKWGGWWSFGAVYLAFILIPILELILPASVENVEQKEELSRSKRVYFDFILYANIPIQIGLLLYFFSAVATRDLQTFEIIGMMINVGVMNGYCINIAHELGHRNNTFDWIMSGTMLLPSFYLHFINEHNFGHHKYVSTDEDPASSRLGENIYAFFVRSVTTGYLNAWRIERRFLKQKGHAFFSIYNKMIWFIFLTIGYLAVIGLVFGGVAMFGALGAGILGFLLLENVNYVEHYGLRRKKLPSGRYEPVQPHHSWNSNHEVGRIFLYELPRHSDHHYKADRKFQVLRHFDESPQMPLGYPGSMLIALIPPLWFSIMDKEVAKFMEPA